MDSSTFFDAHLLARNIAQELSSAHDYHSFSKWCDGEVKQSGVVWSKGAVDRAREDLSLLAAHFGFDLVKREELSKQEAA